MSGEVETTMSQLNLTSWQRQRLRRQLRGTRDVALFQRTLAAVRAAGSPRRVWTADAPLRLRPPAYLLDAF